MRNARWLVAVLIATGCANKTTMEGKRQLNESSQAIQGGDYERAMASADEFLRDHPNGGPGSAEALYFEGRTYEHRAEAAGAADNQTQAKQDLQNAQWSYERAMQQTPSPQLEPLLHAGIANVAYFQENYDKAMNEWAQAYPGLQDKDAKAWVLYRIGLCQQRLGRFEQADTNFALVRQQFPTSEPAARAAAHQGARAFYVQVGAY